MFKPFNLLLMLGAGFIIFGLSLLVLQISKNRPGTTIDVSQNVVTGSTETNSTKIPAPQKSTKILFGGDLMFDRDIRLAMNKHGAEFILQPLTSLFNEYDLVVANLEGPVTNFNSESVGSAPGSPKNFIFTFEPLIIPMLKANNFHLVCLGNNHINNFGNKGIIETKLHLNQNQLSFFGNTGTESTPAERVIVKNINNHQIAFVNLNQFVPIGYQTALEDLQYAKTQAELVIVMTHWGNEYQPKATGVIVDQAHELIENGADLIIGTHPHVVQQSEEYLGKKIYYSLGNMVFDQYFSPETQRGLLVGVEISADKTFTFTEIPIKLAKNGQTQLLE